MRKLLTILLTAMFLVAPIALAEEVTNTTEPSVTTAVSEAASGNLSDAESQAISDTINESTGTQEVSVTPDMPLRWGLKTWTEKLDLLLTFNKFKKAEKKLAQARERLQEMKQMAAKHNWKALVKSQRAHAEIVAELSGDEEALANDNITAAEKVGIELHKHIQILESVQAKLTAKGVPTQGVDNALIKSRNALDKFQNMNETRKAKLFEKMVAKGEKVEVKKGPKKGDNIKPRNYCAEGNLSCISPKTESEEQQNKTEE